jgi:hypothetical protein
LRPTSSARAVVPTSATFPLVRHWLFEHAQPQAKEVVRSVAHREAF